MGEMSGAINVQKIGENAALLEIDNPPANALGSAARKIFVERLDALEADPAIRAIVLTGRGRSFCSGDDLKEQEAAQSAGLSARQKQLAEFAGLLDRIEALRVPVIAAVNGWCMGGGLELALVCDIRIASADATFVCAGVNIGLMASAYRLPRLIGVARAKHMLLTGLPFDSEAAEKFGLVTAVHKSDVLLEQAAELATRIASRAPLSIEATKRMAARAGDLSPEDAAKLTREELSLLVQSEDHAEALAAFREKRAPVFRRK
jgi:enoyl-CoA hydratase